MLAYRYSLTREIGLGAYVHSVGVRVKNGQVWLVATIGKVAGGSGSAGQTIGRVELDENYMGVWPEQWSDYLYRHTMGVFASRAHERSVTCHQGQ